MTFPRTDDRGSSVTRGDGGVVAQVLLGVAVPMFSLALVWQYLDVYLTIWSTPAEVTPGDDVRYAVTAAFGTAAAVGGVILAMIRRRILAACIAVVVAVPMVGMALVFPVPRDRWAAPAPSSAPSDDYVPCYSGSGDCVGG